MTNRFLVYCDIDFAAVIALQCERCRSSAGNIIVADLARAVASKSVAVATTKLPSHKPRVLANKILRS